jgi:hypothetical protein
MHMSKQTNVLRIAAVAALTATAACSGLLDVESPGRIADEDLETRDAINGMVIGMKYDLSQAVDNGNEFLALAALELWHGGSYDWADVPRGIINDDDPGVGGFWGQAQQARWVAESGITNIQSLLEGDFGQSAAAAEAYIYAGYANRMLGANFCSSVISEGDEPGPEVSNTAHFDRAIDQFTNAIPIAQAVGRTDLVNRAYAGRAQARLLAGDWAGAASDAERVPTGFVFSAEIDTEMRNELTYETHTRFEYTVWGTYMEDHTDDPRAPWEIAFNNDGSVANGANGSTPHYMQLKFTARDDDVPLAKGTEMLLIRAEVALRDGDIATAYARMNEARDFHEMDPLEVAGSSAAAWEDLRFERGATLWLESRRLEDERRWFAESGDAHSDFLEGRAKCVPISEAEKLSNPNFRG